MRPAVRPALLSFLLLAGPLLGEEAARLEHARLERRSAASGLEAALRAPAPSPAWFVWAVDSPPEIRARPGGSDGWRECRCSLEDSSSGFNVSDRDDSVAPRTLILSRFESGRPARLEVLSADCRVDAGGMPVVWLDEVRPAESVAWLEKLLPNGPREGRDRVTRERVIAAIALHADPAADAALERFAAPASDEAVRKKAAFWLGEARGRRGLETLRRLAKGDASDEVRRAVTFALSVSPVPEAVDALIGMAKSDASSRVRGQALFWLAQKAGRRAAGAIADAIRDDPETEVKKKAVFALAQLPSDESVTELIRVAKTNRNPEVRRQALFWLGQSKDPRALSYIEEVLTR